METSPIVQSALLLLGPPALIGAACALIPKRGSAYWSAAAIAWLYFLGVNIYYEFYGTERELLQGTFWFFQATLGTLAAFVGFIGCFVANALTQRGGPHAV